MPAAAMRYIDARVGAFITSLRIAALSMSSIL